MDDWINTESSEHNKKKKAMANKHLAEFLQTMNLSVSKTKNSNSNMNNADLIELPTSLSNYNDMS